MASLAIFAAVAFVLLAASVSSSSAALYTVGDARGWAVPPTGSESYNHWGLKNRFRVGDVVGKYKIIADLRTAIIITVRIILQSSST
ncbi:hypothetical protein OsI_08766 [Oryza sativa Indica Group]|jgi:hypothetical protein|uniref:Phytocyanin domain-containing protein n=1 Tax=Oryza sativa subsp. indica TaxID=39946 RepID=A2X952_ORYSI|nr:hypothetical protein OsI_08766 [Oryza sativa Indica Group]